MNKLFLIFLLFITLVSCATEYQINGESSLSHWDGKKLFLKVLNDKELVAIDSSEIVHGLFTMNGKIDSVMMAMLFMDDISIMPLVLEKGCIQVKIDNTEIAAQGTNLNERLYSFFKEKHSLDERVVELERNEARMILNGEPSGVIEEYLVQEEDRLNREMTKLIKAFIHENHGNVLGPGVFLMFASPYPAMTPLLEDVYQDAPESFKQIYLIQEYVSSAKEKTSRLDSKSFP